jgi:hypothetical protein
MNEVSVACAAAREAACASAETPDLNVTMYGTGGRFVAAVVVAAVVVAAVVVAAVVVAVVVAASVVAVVVASVVTASGVV